MQTLVLWIVHDRETLPPGHAGRRLDGGRIGKVSDRRVQEFRRFKLEVDLRATRRRLRSSLIPPRSELARMQHDGDTGAGRNPGLGRPLAVPVSRTEFDPEPLLEHATPVEVRDNEIDLCDDEHHLTFICTPGRVKTAVTVSRRIQRARVRP